MILILFSCLVVLSLFFALTNGFMNGGGLVSTVITSRALEPLPALLLVALCELLGILFFGHAVSETLSRHLLLLPDSASSRQILGLAIAALIGALSWTMVIWWLELSSSTTHALIGGLAGAAVSLYGFGAVRWSLFLQIFIFLALVPITAIALSFVAAKSIRWIGAYLTPAAGRVLARLQILALVAAAMAHGGNDGQKAVGMILLGSLALGGAHAGAPHLAAASAFGCGLVLAIGVIFGSRGTISTVGRGIYRVETIEGFCAEASTLFLVSASSAAGVPMSTSHVMSTSVVGAGVAVHPRAVRWNTVYDIAMAWLVTVPASAAMAWLWMGLSRICHVVP